MGLYNDFKEPFLRILEVFEFNIILEFRTIATEILSIYSWELPPLQYLIIKYSRRFLT